MLPPVPVKFATIKLGHCLVCKNPNVRGNNKCTCKSGYCSWCGQYHWLEAEGFCSACAEDEDRLESVARSKRIERLESRRKALSTQSAAS